MKAPLCLLLSGGISTALMVVAWLIFFPVYQTNDDVAIRLLLEGRVVPDSQPSGYVYFINLAFGQVLATLYKLWPGVSWYDLAEQGTLLLTSAVAFYLCLRAGAGIVGIAFATFLAATFLAIFVQIQFTIVAVLGAAVGLLALMASWDSSASRAEQIGLSVAGTLLVVAASSFRLEGSAMGFLAVVLAAWPRLLYVASAWRSAWARGPLLLIPIFGGIGIAIIWTWHIWNYAASPEWREFFAFNLARAQLAEYSGARMPWEALEGPYASVGWTHGEFRMLANWMLIDPTLFTVEKMQQVIARLPAVPELSALEVVQLLFLYATTFPFFFVAVAGVLVTAANVRTFVFGLATFLFLLAFVLVFSIFIKPMMYRLLWPLLGGYLIALWLVTTATHRQTAMVPTLLGALLLVASATLIIKQVAAASQHLEARTNLVQTELARSVEGNRPIYVIIGSSFPYEALERPFSRPRFQRDIAALPIGTTLWAPPFKPFLRDIAKSDLPSWLCSGQPHLTASPEFLQILAEYYMRRRKEHVRFEPIFVGRTFSTYRCLAAS